MTMISYAQNREDVLLARLFPGQTDGFYLDVGANHPVEHSVTKHFSEIGWRGINVEPHPIQFGRLVEDRPRDVNLNLGVSDREGTLTFHQAEASGWSTFSTAQAANLRAQGIGYEERPVAVTTLAEICERHVEPGRAIEFLKIDAESHERAVLEGADFDRWRPRAVVVEATGHQEWEPILRASDYRFALFDGINRFYLREEDRDLLPRLEAPANATDDFVPHEHRLEILRLHDRLAEFEGMGPDSLAVARLAHRWGTRLPRVKAALRLLLPKAG